MIAGAFWMLGGFDVTLRRCEDYDVYLRMSRIIRWRITLKPSRNTAGTERICPTTPWKCFVGFSAFWSGTGLREGLDLPPPHGVKDGPDWRRYYL